MRNPKSARMWLLNVATFSFFLAVSCSGIVRWLCLPRGFQAGRGVGSVRQLVSDFHRWTALSFVALVVLHLILHWPYIRSNLRGWLARS